MQVAKLNSQLLQALLNHVFPKVCSCCERPLKGVENTLCLACEIDLNFVEPLPLPKDIGQLFWGKSTIEQAFSLYEYRLGSKLQKLLHGLKYEGHKQMIPHFGQLLANAIQSTPELSLCDVIAFPPSSKKNRRKRGFNQAEEIAKVVSSLTDIPMLNLFANRGKKKSQTEQNVYDRHESLQHAFRLNLKFRSEIQGATVLLIDDVVTTGATLSECSLLLESSGVKETKVLSLAYRLR